MADSTVCRSINFLKWKEIFCSDQPHGAQTNNHKLCVCVGREGREGGREGEGKGGRGKGREGGGRGGREGGRGGREGKETERVRGGGRA